MKAKFMCGILAMAFAAMAFADDVVISNNAAVQESQKNAILRWPSLAKEGSRINKEYVQLFKAWKLAQPQIFQRDDWPWTLAEAAATAVHAK